ncbi:hypothetical protein AB0L74_10490 [Streptomyces sp. NPDC052020]|uniref:hypothetical protein n=1 Tax=Streptomyces sp. NPDC052020 TaxID=3155677 RepID=UPI003443571F
MNENTESADAILADLEAQMAVAKLEQRGIYAAAIAILSGDIMKNALAAGVPYSLAQEMAADFWKAEMLADTVAALLRDSELEEDDE